MPVAEHLLRALIPHAVINHDVTAHLGRKGWIETASSPWTLRLGDELPCSTAAMRARTSISVAPWSKIDPDGFNRARLAALEPSLPSDEGRHALAAVACLRTSLEEGLDDATAVATAVSAFSETHLSSQKKSSHQEHFEEVLGPEESGGSDHDVAIASKVVAGAVAWLRGSRVRCVLDLPCLNADHVHFHRALSTESLTALAPSVTRVHLHGGVGIEGGLRALQLLPRATTFSGLGPFWPQFLEALDSRVSEKDDVAMAVAKRLRLVKGPTLARVPNARSREPLFPNVTSLTLGAEIDSPDVWRWVSLHRAIEDLEVDHMLFNLFGDSDDDYNPSPAVALELEDSIVSAFAQIGPSLRKLSITVENSVKMTTPRILASIWEHCRHVRQLTLQDVEAQPGFFSDLAGLRHLRSLTLEDLKGRDTLNSDAIADLVALPAALSQLEELTQDGWDFAIPEAFLVALAALPRLSTWGAKSVRFVDHTVMKDFHGLLRFRALRVAKTTVDNAHRVAPAPNLRLLVLSGGHCDLPEIKFASPYVRVVMARANAPATSQAARALHSSGVFAMCGVLASDATFLAAGSPHLDALPPTVRHAEFASPRKTQQSTLCTKELVQLLTAARDSDLETLTLLHPPDIDTAAAFGDGFRRLRSLTVLGASKAWTDAAPMLQSVCSDVVVDQSHHHRIGSGNPWFDSFT